MSTLYLHCGAHKTGSSFLQTMFARNRELLKDRNVYYPVSTAEYDMLKGDISPGNGQELSQSLTEADPQKAKKILLEGIDKSEKNGCESVLFSSESLFHVFSKEGALDRLKKAAKSAGFDQINALVYFRDPVSHALSTYKHRSKRGDHQDFKYWITKKYETMELLEKFEVYNADSGVEWSCRKYKNNSTFMAESSFKDWLDLKLPEIPEDDRVNQSLTLNEIRVLQCIKPNHPQTVQYIRKAFMEVNSKQKSDDTLVSSLYQCIAYDELKKFEKLINKINQLLPDGEDLVLNTIAHHGGELPPIELSAAELNAFAAGMTKSAKSDGLLYKSEDLWRRGVAKLMRRWKASGIG